jgi:hypothetical protein
VQADDAVADRKRHVARLVAAREREQRGDAGDALHQVVVGGFWRVRPRLPVADEGDIDQLRIDGAQIVVAELQAPHRGRADVADDDVGVLAQPQQRVAPFRPLEVEHDRALVTVELQIDGAHPRIAHRLAAAHHVAVRRLDLDHVGAVVGQNLRRVRSHDDGREVDDAQALQGQHGR